MKNFLSILISLLVAYDTYAQQLGSNSTAITVSADVCTTGCTTLPAKLSIADAVANASTKGVATFAINDFDGTGTISIDYANGQKATALLDGFVSFSGTQTFGGTKIFDGNVSFATSRTLKLWDGSVLTPSLIFSSGSTSGLSFASSGADEAINGSFGGIQYFQFTNQGELVLSNVGEIASKLDINVFHDSNVDATPQDGGVNITTYGGSSCTGPGCKTSTFTGRTAAGSESTTTATEAGQAMAEFTGKGYCTSCGTDGFQRSNRGVFGVYAFVDQEFTNTATFCGIKTTAIGTDEDQGNHMSLMIDPSGNAGLTYLETGLFNSTTPLGWGANADDRFFSIEARGSTTARDAGLLIQNSDGSRGVNIWLDNSENITFIDNLRDHDAAIIQVRLKTKIVGTPVTAMTISTNGTNIGGDATPNDLFTVGSTSQFRVDANGKISKYANTTIADGNLLIGKSAAGGTFEIGTLTQPSSGLTITYSTPNIAFSLANDLAAIEGLSTTGFAVRTGTDTWSNRIISAGTGVTITNGSGVSGDPVINAVPGAIIGGTGNQNVPATTTAYSPIIGTSSYSTTEADRQLVMPYSGTMKNLYIQTSTAQPSSGTYELTIRKNGTATALKVTIPISGGIALYSDTSNNFNFNAGDLISLEAKNNASATSAKIISWSVQITQQ